MASTARSWMRQERRKAIAPERSRSLEAVEASAASALCDLILRGEE